MTQWDTAMGYGDCGEAVKCLAESISSILNNGCAKSGNVLDVIQSVLKSVHDMGDTLDAIFDFLLAALFTALNKGFGWQCPNTPNLFTTALASAVM
ncbi:hypothetical protein N7490_011599 [Penicillium lividum]|nr:hypothetical protein N7490_011599 [Penicillium lividum]